MWSLRRIRSRIVFASALLCSSCAEAPRPPAVYSVKKRPAERLVVETSPEANWNPVSHAGWTVAVPAELAVNHSDSASTAVGAHGGLVVVILIRHKPDCAIRDAIPCTVATNACYLCEEVSSDIVDDTQEITRVSISVPIDASRFLIVSCSSRPASASLCRRVVGTTRKE